MAALPIAIAAMHGMYFLMVWNCVHMAHVIAKANVSISGSQGVNGWASAHLNVRRRRRGLLAKHRRTVS
jgi:hypothetical protein